MADGGWGIMDLWALSIQMQMQMEMEMEMEMMTMWEEMWERKRGVSES